MTSKFDNDFFVRDYAILGQSLALDALYGDRFYQEPKYTSWKMWFAWRPVKVRTWQEVDGIFYKRSSWVWLKTVSTRKVIYGNKPLGLNSSQEYVETFDLLKFIGVKLSDL